MSYKLLDFINLKAAIATYANMQRADINAKYLKNAEEKIRKHLGLKDDEKIPYQNIPLPAELDDAMDSLKGYVELVEDMAPPFQQLVGNKK